LLFSKLANNKATMENETPYIEEKKEQKSQNTALWVLLILSLAGNAYLAYNYYENNFAGGKSLKIQNQELLNSIKTLNLSKDSLQVEFDAVYKQFQDAASQSISSSEEKAVIVQELEKKKIQFARLLAQGGGPALLKAKGEIEGLKKEMMEYQIKVERLQQENDGYASSINGIQEEAKTIAAKATRIEEEKTKLEKKISNSLFFQVSEFKVVPQRTKRGAKEETAKASRVENMSIKFELIPTDIIEHGNKTIFVRILGVNGEVLTNDNDILEDSDQLATFKYDFNYTGTPESVSYNFKQTASYKKGKYSVEIVQDGRLLTKGNLVLE
jgi:hypothetical protein